MDVMKKVPVREQAPDVRNKNFDEVCLGYNAEEAQEEACLLYTDLHTVFPVDIHGHIQQVMQMTFQ